MIRMYPCRTHRLIPCRYIHGSNATCLDRLMLANFSFRLYQGLPLVKK
eukprot:Gb_41130 [translate_table: standard]